MEENVYYTVYTHDNLGDPSNYWFDKQSCVENFWETYQYAIPDLYDEFFEAQDYTPYDILKMFIEQGMDCVGELNEDFENWVIENYIFEEDYPEEDIDEIIDYVVDRDEYEWEEE